MQRINLSICGVDGTPPITMRLIADLEIILGYDNFLQFHNDLSNLNQSTLPMHKLIDVGEYLLQKLGCGDKKAEEVINRKGQTAVKEIIMALSNIVAKYAATLPKSSEGKKAKTKLEPTPWKDYYRVYCGMMGLSEDDLMNTSPDAVFEAIEGFKQFHSTSDKKAEEKDPQSLIDSFESM